MKTTMKIAVMAMMGMSLGVNAQVSQTLSGGTPLYFTSIGTGTYDKTVLYHNKSNGFHLELAKLTNSNNSNPIDFNINARGGNHPFFTIKGSNGNVGIGTINPKTKLDVNGHIKGRDFVSGGSNSWVFHTPDDGRRNLYLAPRKSDDSGWDWSKYTIFYDDGQVSFKNKISVNGEISGRDFVSGGSNSWVFHTPDDGRKNLYLAPRKSDDSGWDWSKYTIFYGSGKVAFKNNISVNGRIESKEVKISNTPTADFVFEEDYNLPTLKSIEKYVKEKKHLPEIASAKEMEKNGVNVGKFQIQLLQKIEELTLYTIDQENKIKTLEMEKVENKKQQKEIEEQRSKIERLEFLVEKLLKDKN